MADWWANEFYSQFGEDGILFTYFRNKAYSKYRDMDHLDRGFFVDVGAHHPFMLSNTWAFYKRGWRGVNIDPTPGCMELFNSSRPEDINLEIAVAQQEGEASLYYYGLSVYNTLAPESIVRDGVKAEIIKVQTCPLSVLLDRYFDTSLDFSLLSVDVEGLDLVVLQSNNWEKFRPELVVVELHVPSVEEIIRSEIYSAMSSWGYCLYGWAKPSLIFRRND